MISSQEPTCTSAVRAVSRHTERHALTDNRHGYTQTNVQMGYPAVAPMHHTPIVPLVPLESRAPQRRSLPRCVHPTAASRRPASAPATGFSEGDIAPAACPVILPTPQVAQKPRHGPRLMTYWSPAGAALAAFCSSRHRVERRCHASSAHRGQGLITTGQRTEGAAAALPTSPPGAPRVSDFRRKTRYRGFTGH